MLPLIFIVGLAIAVIDRNPIIFKQQRAGLHKESFIIYKFTSMKNGKITLLGKVIRKTGLDEIPQLLNIMKGEMAFVGPRPLTKSDIERLEWDGKDKSVRWNVLPGITGPAQLVNVCDKDVSFQNDLNYIQTRSIKTDLKYILLSLVIPITGKQFVKRQIHKS